MKYEWRSLTSLARSLLENGRKTSTILQIPRYKSFCPRIIDGYSNMYCRFALWLLVMITTCCFWKLWKLFMTKIHQKMVHSCRTSCYRKSGVATLSHEYANPIHLTALKSSWEVGAWVRKISRWGNLSTLVGKCAQSDHWIQLSPAAVNFWHIRSAGICLFVLWFVIEWFLSKFVVVKTRR